LAPRVSHCLLLRLCHVSRTGLTSTTRRPVAPALLRLCRAFKHTISPLDFSSFGCIGSLCAPGHRVSRLDYLSPGAQALQRLSRAYGRVVSPLNFSLVGRTGSHHAPGHSLSRLDCAAAQLVVQSRWLYTSHAVHCDYLSRGNTGSTSSTPRATATSSSGRIASTTHLD
jgi:hypothetical protein